MLVTVNNTFASPTFQKLITTGQKNVLLVADEMHNLGAATYRRALPDSVRLGLAYRRPQYGMVTRRGPRPWKRILANLTSQSSNSP